MVAPLPGERDRLRSPLSPEGEGVAPVPLGGEGVGVRVGSSAVYMPLVIATALALFMGLAT